MNQRFATHPNLELACKLQYEWHFQANEEWTNAGFNRWLMEHYGVEYIQNDPYLRVHDPEKYLILILKYGY
jgi:hypothetical protein